MNEKEINDRLTKAIEGHDTAWHVGPYRNGRVEIRATLCASELRVLANAIDTEDDATAAAIHDLKEESVAYQRGLKQGAKEERERMWAESKEVAVKNVWETAGWPVALWSKEGESILVRAVETPAEQVRKERETMQLLHDMVWQLWNKGYHLRNEERDAYAAVVNRARQAILEYERERTERLSGPDGR